MRRLSVLSIFLLVVFFLVPGLATAAPIREFYPQVEAYTCNERALYDYFLCVDVYFIDPEHYTQVSLVDPDGKVNPLQVLDSQILSNGQLMVSYGNGLPVRTYGRVLIELNQIRYGNYHGAESFKTYTEARVLPINPKINNANARTVHSADNLFWITVGESDLPRMITITNPYLAIGYSDEGRWRVPYVVRADQFFSGGVLGGVDAYLMGPTSLVREDRALMDYTLMRATSLTSFGSATSPNEFTAARYDNGVISAGFHEGSGIYSFGVMTAALAPAP